MRWARQHLRGGIACAVVGLALAGAGPASAQLLVPENFFNAPIDPTAPTEVEADELVFDSVNNVITARGDVVLGVGGYVITGDELVYRRASGDMDVVGNTSVTDPAGNVTRSPTLSLTGGMKRAVLNSMTITAYDGSRITADSAEFDQVLETILVNAEYAPCGECIDSKGRRIGWSISAARIVQNNEDGSISFEQPTLSLVGVPVAWLPYLWLPDLSNEGLDRIPRPTFGYSDAIGLKAEVSYTAYSSRWTDIILTPTLLTNQGFLLGAEWVQRFDSGSMRIKASGLYQFRPDAFTFAPAQREWRGAIQAQGEFVPVKDWTAGFAYAAFTDSAYFKDYLLEPRRAGINEVYATHLTEDTFVDARVQQYNVLGDTVNADQITEQQGVALPNLRVERTFDLAPGAGRVDVEARMLNIYRAREYTTSAAGVVNGAAQTIPYDYGYGGTRLHGMTQASWQNQYVFGGAVVTPFAGVRLDAAGYDQTNGQPLNPVAPANSVLFGATPIAAIDVRYPFAAYGDGMTHLIEPIAQLVYRGASSIQPGITNEDSQSVVFDDSNLFSYNRFNGIDRQETGLRANLGGRYLLDFNDGNYLELIGGQSFQLAGTNVFAEPNRQQVGVATGLDVASSYGVLGAYAMLYDTIKTGGKVQVDSANFTIARASLGTTYTGELFSAGLNYRYAAPTPTTGNVKTQHEIGAELSVPFADYWTVTGQAYWDLSANSYLLAGGGLTYNDGFLSVGASAIRTGPTHTSPNDTRFLASFRLTSPAGLDLGYSGAVPIVSDLVKRLGTP